MRAARPRAASILLGAALVALTPRAHAEAAPNRARSAGYYAVTGAVTASLLGGSYALYRFGTPGEPGGDPSWFPGDESLRGRSSAAAARLSDVLLLTTVVEPVAFHLGKGADTRFLNTELVYSQTLSANLLLNIVAKNVFHRPRPYTYGQSRAESDRDSDAYVSFYSGHSSTSFAAATAGAYLFAESAPDRTSRLFAWGIEMGFASATAGLRLRAGKHYYSDVLVGILMGTGMGIGVPLSHGAKYVPSGDEFLVASCSFVGGMALSQLLPFPSSPKPAARPPVTWTLGPVPVTRGVAFGASGHFY